MTRRTGVVIYLIAVATVAMVVAANWRDARAPLQPPRRPLAPVSVTTRDDLSQTIERMRARLTAQPNDEEAVIRLADALIRVQRVDGDAEAVIEAETRLRTFLAARPGHYEAQRMLGPVLLSQHRFRDALREAEQARAEDPGDAFNYGVIADAAMELGDYTRAFEAIDTMGRLKPGPSAYARVAHALEIKGDLDGAFEQMTMAAEGTSAHDAEGQAWHYAQLGALLLQMGRLGDARRQFERAEHTFPSHPYAMMGLARLKIAEGDYPAAKALVERLHAAGETPETAALLGDLHARLGDPDRADALYALAERLERDGWQSEEPQPQALARFLAERNRSIDEAVRLAEEAASRRRDIHTMDALALAYFRAGRLDEARVASGEALRTGTADARILAHAAAIHDAAGDRAGAETLRARMRSECFECRF